MENYKYTVIETELTRAIKRTDSSGLDVWIPLDEANADYQAYLLWIKENG